MLAFPVLAIVVIATLLSFAQPASRNPAFPVLPDGERAGLLARAWHVFAYPIESNALLRLPAINRPLVGLYTVEGTPRVYLLGEGGLLLMSSDSGETWEDWRIPIGMWNKLRQPPSGAKARGVEVDLPVVCKLVVPLPQSGVPNPAVQAPPSRNPANSKQPEKYSPPERRELGDYLRVAEVAPGRLWLGNGRDAWVRSQETVWTPSASNAVRGTAAWLSSVTVGGSRLSIVAGTPRLERDGFPASREVQDSDLKPAPGLRYERYPAGWYFAVIAGCCLLMAWSGWRSSSNASKRARTGQTILIDSHGTSDSPLLPGEHDVLNLDARAEAMAVFLRNPRTSAPITIAVQGPWGSGKSSYLNILKGKLDHAGFSTVVFNAWHHQTEASLLAALLQHIRTDGLPGWSEFRGLIGPRFRWRLLSSRFAARATAHPLRMAASVLLGSFSIGLLVSAPREVGTWLADTAGVVEPIWNELTGKKVVATQEPHEQPRAVGSSTARRDTAIGGGALGLTALLTTLLPTLRAMRAFGFDPVDTVKTAVSRGDEKRTASATLSTASRTQFAKKFGEVTAAIGPERKMVIFIDDLDRCDAESVVQMLQAMNYLVTAGQCVIVAAFDPDYVKACIRLKYKPLIAELNAKDSVPPPDFAAHFLQKLIQVNETVPRLNADQTVRLFKYHPKEDAAGQRDKSRKRARRQIALVGFGLLSLFGAGSLIRLASHPEATPIPEMLEGAAPVDDDVGALSAAESTGDGPLVVLSDPPSAWRWWYLGPALGSLALLAMALASSLAEGLPEPVQDSPEFERTVNRYSCLLTAAGRTPREVKRLLNGMRLTAARQSMIPGQPNMSVENLVALAILHDLDSTWMQPPYVDSTRLDELVAKLAPVMNPPFADDELRWIRVEAIKYAELHGPAASAAPAQTPVTTGRHPPPAPESNIA
ncbi:MAG: KAP family P-loop NTPase fold protein [Phycisphaerales bacterium]